MRCPQEAHDYWRAEQKRATSHMLETYTDQDPGRKESFSNESEILFIIILLRGSVVAQRETNTWKQII